MDIKIPGTSLRAWQREALAAWVGAGYRGIVAAATGTGKTLFAVHAIAQAPVERTIVVVPKQALQDQWLRMFRTGLDVSPLMLGSIGGKRKDFNLKNRVVVAVIDSARRGITEPVRYWQSAGERVMLVVDECHWAGSAQSMSMFEVPCDATLGLSATPERGDDGFDDVLVPNLGPIVFRYRLRQALDDGLLADLTSVHEYFELSGNDHAEYESLETRSAALRNSLAAAHPELLPGPGWDARLAKLAVTNPAARQLKGLLASRGEVVARSKERLKVVDNIARSGLLRGKRSLVFNENVTQATRVLEIFERHGLRCDLEHSRLPSERREAALRRFATGSIDALVAVRALDEGIDVPDAEVALIVSGTLNARQRIQRIGRVVRPNGRHALVISILALGTSEEYDVGDRDGELLGPERVVRGLSVIG